MKIHYKIPLPEGKTIAELSSQELCQQRDAFTHWLDQQPVHIHNEDKPFLNAFKTLIQIQICVWVIKLSKLMATF